ncbi:cyclopentanone 1,2-monooxygenase [Piedraia hortae CBS 480.64]|uniref:Cyclopentanone 1,2-monooxygenase n=1 Tax=Piedraia hortae CBS 480.64 TaxID=1314780 RepID=A0A6A7BY54_9PEZI|nr:cyclopentanone 1,2-monooxygenase [Piedraia hortae CBS 480.64]
MQRSLGTNGTGTRQDTSNAQHLDLEVCIVGAGFAGIYLLHRMREEGFTGMKIIEAGNMLGGTWAWNSYPGARVDSPYPVYQMSIPQLYDGWVWKEKYPSSAELKEYFKHVDKVLDISRDVIFNTKVTEATFNASSNRWHVTCDDGTTISCHFLISCVGFAARRHFPDWPGFDKFQGFICHSSFWPQDGVNIKSKSVAVVGTGATGIQIAQEFSKEASHLTAFVRTPNLCLPMRQSPIDPTQIKQDAETLHEILSHKRFENTGGFNWPTPTRAGTDDTPAQREAVFESVWQRGGFEPLFTYTDMLTNESTNNHLYDFWARKTRSRMTDPYKKSLLIPEIAPHPFGGKRPSLEQDYYEQMDKPHVTLIDVKSNPITHLTEKGIVTADGKVHECDVIALATGFDTGTGSIKEVDFIGVDGITLVEKWKRYTWTYLGMAVHGFPNFFFTYGPHSPTAYVNGPSLVEPQAEWILSVMQRMKQRGFGRIEAKEEAEKQWSEMIRRIHALTLRDRVEGWYMGTNIPGKPREAMNYAGELKDYLKTLRDVLERDFEGFEMTKVRENSVI